MLRLKSIGIAVAIICSLLLISIVNSSKADIEIVEMSASGYTSSDGGTLYLCPLKPMNPMTR